VEVNFFSYKRLCATRRRTARLIKSPNRKRKGYDLRRKEKKRWAKKKKLELTGD